jgi:hypothetical protein
MMFLLQHHNRLVSVHLLEYRIVQNRHMRVIRVATGEQLADTFTKELPFPQFERCLFGVFGECSGQADGLLPVSGPGHR